MELSSPPEVRTPPLSSGLCPGLTEDLEVGSAAQLVLSFGTRSAERAASGERPHGPLRGDSGARTAGQVLPFLPSPSPPLISTRAEVRGWQDTGHSEA